MAVFPDSPFDIAVAVVDDVVDVVVVFFFDFFFDALHATIAREHEHTKKKLTKIDINSFMTSVRTDKLISNLMQEYIRDHYDTHAVNTSSRKERARGIAAPLKTYHNAIKRELIATFASNTSSLLDIGCGRGGDLGKWENAKIKRVFGIDLSAREIDEAKRRYAAGTWKHMTCDFSVSSTLTTKDWYFKKVDTVSCMFALQYFFGSEHTLNHVLRNVSASLKTGGYFIGTVPDGAKIQCAVSGPMLRIQRLWTGPPRPFGCAYICDIADTVTSGGSIEYLVDQNTFVDVAAKYGLYPVGENAFTEFRPTFTADDPSLVRASELFTSFAFQKK
jgi:mRNA (guanine-N7-)-methyltransferase